MRKTTAAEVALNCNRAVLYSDHSNTERRLYSTMAIHVQCQKAVEAQCSRVYTELYNLYIRTKEAVCSTHRAVWRLCDSIHRAVWRLCVVYTELYGGCVIVYTELYGGCVIVYTELYGGCVILYRAVRRLCDYYTQSCMEDV